MSAIATLQDLGFRSTLILVLLLVAFGWSLFVYGADATPARLIIVLVASTFVMALIPGRLFLQSLRTFPLTVLVCYLVVFGLFLHASIVSERPETSHPASLVLVCLPLWVLIAIMIPHARWLWFMMSVLIGLVGLVASLEFLVWKERAHAPLVDPGNFVTLIAMMWLPTMASLLGYESRKSLTLLGLMSFFCSLAILASHSRFSWVVIAICLSAVGLSWAFQRNGKASFISTFVGVLCAVACYLLFDGSGALSTLQEVRGGDEAASPRLLLWNAAWELIVDYGGLSGTGLNTFSLLYPSVRSPLEYGTTGLFVHNDLLQLSLELGLWTVLPTLFLICFLMRRFLKAIRSRQLDMRSLGVLGGIGIALLHSFVNFVFYVLPLLLVLGTLLGILSGDRVRRDSSSSGGLNAEWGMAVAALAKWGLVSVLLFNIGLFGLDTYTRAVFSKDVGIPGVSYFQSSLEKSLGYVKLTQRINSNRSTPFLAETRLLERLADLEASPLLASQLKSAHQKLMEQEHLIPASYLRYSKFLRSQNQQETQVRDVVDHLLLEAIRIRPYEVQTNIAALHWYRGQQDAKNLSDSVRRIVVWCKAMDPEAPVVQLFEMTLSLDITEPDRLQAKACARFLEQKMARKKARREGRNWRWLREI